ncbi:MAG: molecular chaperone TorD family protein [Desulfovibrionaceae bacterium]|nr:molecular chaperone TorD family protein [Desulfovibrionaceae bacterium]
MPISDAELFLLSAIELCAAVFRGPGAADWKALTDSGVPELLDRVQHFPGFPDGPLHGLEAGLAGCASDFGELETEYVRLFIAGPGGVPAPLYESCHAGGDPRTMGEPALAMRDRLAREGLAVNLDSNEPPDHLAIELEYLYHLLAQGWSGSDPAQARRGVLFAAEVMLPWVRRFRAALAGADPHPVFLAASDLALAILAAVPAA